MTKGEAIYKANWWLHEVGWSAYIFKRKDTDLYDEGYFVMAEHDSQLRDAYRYADLIEYCDVRMCNIDRDIWEKQGVGHS